MGPLGLAPKQVQIHNRLKSKVGSLSFMGKSQRSRNDQRSDAKNPTSSEYQSAIGNRSDQMNPNNPAYHSHFKRAKKTIGGGISNQYHSTEGDVKKAGIEDTLFLGSSASNNKTGVWARSSNLEGYTDTFKNSEELDEAIKSGKAAWHIVNPGNYKEEDTKQLHRCSCEKFETSSIDDLIKHKNECIFDKATRGVY